MCTLGTVCCSRTSHVRPEGVTTEKRGHSFAPFFWTRPCRSEVHVMDLSSRVSTLLGPQQPVPSSTEVGARNAGRTAWPTSLQTLSTEAAWPPLGLKDPRCACGGTWRRACDARKERMAPTKTQKTKVFFFSYHGDTDHVRVSQLGRFYFRSGGIYPEIPCILTWSFSRLSVR